MSDTSSSEKPVIFFDGVCGLCNGFVDWVISRDKSRSFLFSPLQGQSALKNLHESDRVNLEYVVVLLPNGEVLRESKGVIFVLKKLPYPYRIAGVLLGLIPHFILKWGYEIVAKCRYKIFGKKDVCRIPSSEERSLFID